MMMENFFFASFFFVDKSKFVDKQKNGVNLAMREVCDLSPVSVPVLY